MAALPVRSGRDVVRAFCKGSWQMARQRGSHIILVKAGSIATLSVLDHKEIAKWVPRGVVRTSGLKVEQFVELLP